MSAVARGAAINLAARVAALILGLTVTVFTARMGTEEQGRFALFTAIEALWMAAFSGFGLVLARHASASYRVSPALSGAVAGVCVALGTVGALAMLTLSHWGRESYSLLWIFAIGAPLLLVPGNLSGLWLGQGRMAPIAVLTVAPSLLTLVIFAMFAATAFTDGTAIVWMLLAWALARVAIGSATLFRFWRVGHLQWPAWHELAPHATFVAAIGAANLVSLVNYKVDLFLVEHYLGLSPTGVYSIAILVAESLWLLSSSLTQAAYARLGATDREAASQMALRVMQANLLALAAASPLLYVVAAWLLPRVLGGGYDDVAHLLLWFLPGIVAYGAASVMSAYFTNHVGRPGVPASMALLSALVNLALCVVLIPQLGAVGGALATSVSYVLSVSVMIGLFMRHAQLRPSALLTVDWSLLWRVLRPHA